MFIIILFGLFFLALKPPTAKLSGQIKSIKILGNRLLAEDSYLRFAKLNEVQNSSEVTLSIVKDRIEKHPFIARAEVELSEHKDAQIYLHEKKLAAIVMCDDKTYLLSDELQLLPLYSGTKFMDLPIINRVKNSEKFNALDFLKSDEIKEAYNIIYAIKSCDKDLYKHLSEINLNNGDETTIVLSGFHPIIKFGMEDIPKKVLMLCAIWNEIKNGKYDLNESDYVDLRFSNQIYFGKVKVAEI
jgi:cell division protein FtsQ